MNCMNDQLERFKRMMKLAKENQECFRKQLEQFEDYMQSSNFGEFPANTLFTDKDLEKLNKSQNDRQENDLHKSNRDSIDELSDHLKIRQAGSTEGYLANIGHSLMMIANSLRHIEDHLDKGREQNGN